MGNSIQRFRERLMFTVHLQSRYWRLRSYDEELKTVFTRVESLRISRAQTPVSGDVYDEPVLMNCHLGIT